MEHRSRARGASPLPQRRKLGRRTRRIVQEGGLSRRKRAASRVVRRLVDRCTGVELLSHRPSREVDAVIGPVVGHEVGPAKIPGRPGLVDLIVPPGTAWPLSPRIGPHVAPVQVPGRRVDADPPRIATPHHVNLGTPLAAIRGKEIPLGNFVATVRGRPDPQDLAVVTVSVPRGRLGIEGGPSRPFVDRRESLRVAKRVGVVSSRDEQLPSRTELQRPGVMAALLPLLGVLQQQSLTCEIEAPVPQGEPADVLPLVVGRTVLQVEMPVPPEVGVQRQSNQPVLLRGGDCQFANQPHLVEPGIENLELPLQLNEVHLASRAHRQFHRLPQAGDQLGQFEAGRIHSPRLMCHTPGDSPPDEDHHAQTETRPVQQHRNRTPAGRQSTQIG